MTEPVQPMSFIWPTALVLLILVPLLTVVYVALQRRRQRLIARYGSFGLTQFAGRQLGVRRHIPPALFLAALAVLIVALARPETVVSMPAVEGNVILAFDVSGSMAAEDLKPNRMEAAKAAAREFVERQPPGVLIGVVAFSDSGLSIQVPTDDEAAILASINRLAPQRGTSLANGILASLTTIDDAAEKATNYYSNSDEPAPTPTPMPKGVYAPAVIVLLTDGENTAPPNPLEAAQASADSGVRIYTVGVGSAEGSTLHVEGFTVRSRLDEATLQQISHMTDGQYFNASTEQDLQAIYQNINPQFVVKPEKMEVTSLVAGAGMLILLIGSAFSMVWLSRLP